MIKNQKGITLVSLIITIILMGIVASTVIYTSLDRFEINNVRKMTNDIELLQDKVSNYYLKYGVLPVLRDNTNTPIQYTNTSLDFEKNSADDDTYYILDLKAMEGISLNYGKIGFENPNSSNDVYIINRKSHTIYYVKGIKMDGEMYYSKSFTSDINDTIPPSSPQIRVLSGSKNSKGTYINIGAVELELIPGKEDGNVAKKTEFSTDNGSTWININGLDNNIYQIRTTGQHSIKIRSYDKNDNISENSIDLSVEIRERKTLTAYSEDQSWLDLPRSYLGRLSDYKIYGNSIQDTETNGDPSPTNPVEIQSVGDLVTDTTDSNYGKYKIPVKVSGKNLFDEKELLKNNISGTEYYSIDNNGITLLRSNGAAWSDLNTVVTLPEGTYTLSNTIEDVARAQIYDEYNNEIKLSSKLPVTFTLTETKKLKIKVLSKTSYPVSIGHLQIEKGTTATDYETYVEPVTTNIYLNEPLRKIGDYADYIDFENSKVIREIKSIQLNGSETWALQSTNSYGIANFLIENFGAFKDTQKYFSNSFVAQDTLISNTQTEGMYYANASAFYIRLKSKTASTVIEFKEWLSKNNVQINHVLSTSMEEPIKLPELKSFNEYTRIEVLTEIEPSKIEATYDGYEIK